MNLYFFPSLLVVCGSLSRPAVQPKIIEEKDSLRETLIQELHIASSGNILLSRDTPKRGQEVAAVLTAHSSRLFGSLRTTSYRD